MNYLIVSFLFEESQGLHARYIYDVRRAVFVGQEEAMRWAWSEMEKGRGVQMSRTDESPVTE